MGREQRDGFMEWQSTAKLVKSSHFTFGVHVRIWNKNIGMLVGNQLLWKREWLPPGLRFTESGGLQAFQLALASSAYLTFGFEEIWVDPQKGGGRFELPTCSDSAILAEQVGNTADITLLRIDGFRSRSALISLRSHISFHRIFVNEQIFRTKHVHAVTEPCCTKEVCPDIWIRLYKGRQPATRPHSLRPGALRFQAVYADPPFLHHGYLRPLPTCLSANQPLGWLPWPPPQSQMSSSRSC